MQRIIYLTLLSGVVASSGSATAKNQTWEKIQIPGVAHGRNLRSIFFWDAKHGWIVGDQGLCLVTCDGGKTWETRDIGSRATLRCVRFQDPQTGWICGDGDPKAPDVNTIGKDIDRHTLSDDDKHNLKNGLPMVASSVFHTIDGGKNWQTYWLPTNFEIHDISQLGTADKPLFQAAASASETHPDGDFFQSRDKGKTWHRQIRGRSMYAFRQIEGANRVVAVGGVPAFYKVYCIMLGKKEEDIQSRALYSEDDCKSWKVCEGSEVPGNLRALAVQKSRPVLAVGDAGALLRSEDGGLSWEEVESTTKQHLRCVVWCGKVAVAVGEGGTVLIGTDNGKHWASVAMDQKEALFGVAVAGDDVIAVGEKGIALRTKISELVKKSTK